MNERSQGPARRDELSTDVSGTKPAGSGEVSRDVEAAAASRNETHLRLLVETGLLLARERNLDTIVQAALDAGVRLCGATFGAFFYNNVGSDGETYRLFKLSGIDPAAFAHFPMPRPTAVFAPSFHGEAVVRSADITADPRYGKNSPLTGMPPGHVPVRSYLAVPVRSRSGETLGAMLFGHPAVGVFAEPAEDLVSTVASQAAVAIDNARLTESLSLEIAAADAARSLQRATADRLTQVLESTTDGVALLDRDWRFTYINPFANHLIAPGRRLVGTGFRDLFPGDLGSVFHRRYAEAMDHGRTVEFTEYYAPLQLWAQVRVFPTPEGIAIFFQDVTRQRLQEAALAENARRLRQALDAAKMGTWTWNRETDVLDLDDRAHELMAVAPGERLTRAEMRERPMTPQDHARVIESLHRSVTAGALHESEFHVSLPGGERRWLELSGIPSFAEARRPGPDGRPEISGMIGTVQDVTARKTQEATLRESEKLAATGRLAATIAHEINNPLEAVTNLIYLAKTDPELPSHLGRMLETADNELARVAGIAQQTLGFYRDTSRPAVIDLNELIAAVADLFSRKLASKQLALTLDLDPGLSMQGLQGEIRQVISNLLVNAIDASTSGTIHIRGRKRRRGEKDHVALLICDRGTGIPVHLRDRLFTPFVTSKEKMGTGLGLWVTRGMVEKHGGTISFRSCVDEGAAGTVFRIHLPTEHPTAQYFDSPRTTRIQ